MINSSGKTKKLHYRCNVLYRFGVIVVNMERQEFEIEAKRMRPALLRLAERYMESADDAEDVIQEVLLKLWFLRERLNNYRSIDALAVVITKHLCINNMRKRKMETVALEKSMGMEGGEIPDMKLIEEEGMQEILQAIATLPDLQQSVLRMKHIEGFEVEEIARLLGSTAIAVRTNLSRARKKICEQFKRKERR